MVEKDTVRRGYNDAAEAFASWRSFDDHERAIIERFLESFAADPTVLDAGCGGGDPILRTILERRPGAEPVGLDISSEQVKRAAEHVPGAAILRGDLTRLPVADGSFDGVVAFHSLIHVPAEQHRWAIEEFARVVRPGGRVLVSEGVEPWEGDNPDWLETGVEMGWHIAGAETTRRQIREGGLTIENEWDVSDVLVEAEEWVFFEAVLEG